MGVQCAGKHAFTPPSRRRMSGARRVWGGAGVGWGGEREGREARAELGRIRAPLRRFSRTRPAAAPAPPQSPPPPPAAPRPALKNPPTPPRNTHTHTRQHTTRNGPKSCVLLAACSRLGLGPCPGVQQHPDTLRVAVGGGDAQRRPPELRRRGGGCMERVREAGCQLGISWVLPGFRPQGSCAVRRRTARPGRSERWRSPPPRTPTDTHGHPTDTHAVLVVDVGAGVAELRHARGGAAGGRERQRRPLALRARVDTKH